MIILALDALDLQCIQKFNCKNLMQKEHGQTTLKGFNQERTIVLWASFLTGKNMEKEIPIKNQWEFKLQPEQTFLKFFNNYKVIDLPAFSYKQKNHEEERKLLKGYFEDKTTVEEYENLIWKIHQENKKDFFQELGKPQLLIGYFNLADTIGHLSFGLADKMATVYEELDKIAEEVKNLEEFTLIISDHGMKAVGRYGDHSRNGFYSSNHTLGLDFPEITSFYKIIRGIAKNESS